MFQITSRGVVAPPSAAGVTQLSDRFRTRRCVRVRSMIEGRLLSRVQAQIAAASFAERAHGSISTELCMDRNACLGLLNFLANDPALFRFVQQVTGCGRLTSFVGRVYRLTAGGGYYDSWHADLHPDHQIGLSMNLGTEPFDGGVFEIRRAETAEPLAAIANTGAGDAILFAIAEDVEHRITPMAGAVAKTAFAGWFGAARDYRDVVRQTQTRSHS